MKLYHGSNTGINSINLAMCLPYKDFGTGFYLTDKKEQAERIYRTGGNLVSPGHCVRAQCSGIFISLQRKMIMIKYE